MSVDVYRQICEFTPTREQKEVFDALTNWDAARNPLLLRLPCGYGKTEAVVIPFLSQAINNKWTLAPRLIYVLPTRALCNQIRDRICQYAEKVADITGKIITVGIEHGVSSLDPLFFSDICITTFDQLLYGYARTKQQIGRHFDLPAGSIANSVVVFDEAHLYSPYTHSLMRALIEILLKSRIPVVIMTATMPQSLETDLLGDVKEKKTLKIVFNGQWPDFMTKRTVAWKQADWGLLNGDALTDELVALLRKDKNKRILIVVNRVDTAQKIAKVLEERDSFVTLIHSRFTVEDRAEKESTVCKLYGKKQAEIKSAIIVSTQVCEVGLDISCDLLITECAPADALVQRAGRVKRWGGDGKIVIVRPMGTEKALDDTQWGEAFPYVDRKKDEDSRYPGVKKGEYSGLAWEYLKSKAPENLFVDWTATTEFCNEMDYRTNDVAARSALGQLFDSTLYADDRPWNLSAREELYCTLAVLSSERITQQTTEIEVDKKKSKKVKKRGKTEQQIPYDEMKKTVINVPFRYLLHKKTEKLRPYDFTEGKVQNELGDSRVRPFRTYLIEPAEHYDSDIGLVLEKKEKAGETEEGAACLII